MAAHSAKLNHLKQYYNKKIYPQKIPRKQKQCNYGAKKSEQIIAVA
jgi:hypothetical protein